MARGGGEDEDEERENGEEIKPEHRHTVARRSIELPELGHLDSLSQV